MNLFKRIRRDERGAAIVEFALVAPTLTLLLMGLFELGHTMYVQSIVNGAMQETARDSTIENAKIAQMMKDLEKNIQTIAPKATVQYTRKALSEYSMYNKLEDFTDLNMDGKCNDGEPFIDVNDSYKHDKAKGKNGQGDANDIVVFEVEVTYKRLFPMYGITGWSAKNTVAGTTLLRNQPFRQNQSKPPVRNCS